MSDATRARSSSRETGIFKECDLPIITPHLGGASQGKQLSKPVDVSVQPPTHHPTNSLITPDTFTQLPILSTNLDQPPTMCRDRLWDCSCACIVAAGLKACNHRDHDLARCNQDRQRGPVHEPHQFRCHRCVDARISRTEGQDALSWRQLETKFYAGRDSRVMSSHNVM